jgi:hypothetical protein
MGTAPAGPIVSVELDADDAIRAHEALAGVRPSPGAAWEAGSTRRFALVDLGAAPPGWVALTFVEVADVREPVVVALVVGSGSSGTGVEHDLLAAVSTRLRAIGARRLRIGAGVAIDL